MSGATNAELTEAHTCSVGEMCNAKGVGDGRRRPSTARVMAFGVGRAISWIIGFFILRVGDKHYTIKMKY